ncbi:hypothetical protein GRJ2_000149700 [Grus japonensis]|uniref:Secreted protein n=1 Tax=Grus japonensis TaxID=30415 RepID=A0ABC9VTW9_GRUJA
MSSLLLHGHLLNLVLFFNVFHLHCLVGTVLHLYRCHLVTQCPLLVPGHKISQEATSRSEQDFLQGEDACLLLTALASL